MNAGAYLSSSAWATPHSLNERKRAGKPPMAEAHLVIPHGKSSRAIVVELNREALLTVIANAADALRLLDSNETKGDPVNVAACSPAVVSSCGGTR